MIALAVIPLEFPFIPAGFNAPTRLLLVLLVPLIVAAYIVALRMRNKRGMRFTNTSMLEVVVPKQSQWRRHLALALTLLSVVFLTMAFAKPTNTVQVPKERATVILILDTSLSMQAKDVKPNRLAAAQDAASGFVQELPDKYNVALVSLYGSPSIVMRPTLDHQAVIRAIKTLKLQESTAIGESIAQALRALQQAPKDPDDPDKPAPGAIVLLSDGGNTNGRAPVQVAAQAKKDKVPIYTIAYGTDNGYVDVDGQREPVPVDKALLKQVADATGGKTFSADNVEQLKQVYANIGSDIGYVKSKREATGRYAGLGLTFAALAALAAISLAARWP